LQVKKFVFLAAIMLFAVACGATPGHGSGSDPTPTPGGGVGFDVVVTQADHEVTLHLGQKLEVVLHTAQGMNSWSHPVSNDQSALAPIVDPAATTARGVTLAAFQAKKAGAVTVTSYAGPACSPGAACPMYVAVYSLRVTITP
jgi:hypothetical protein